MYVCLHRIIIIINVDVFALDKYGRALINDSLDSLTSTERLYNDIIREYDVL